MSEEKPPPPVFKISPVKVRKEDVEIVQPSLIDIIKADMVDAMEQVLLEECYGPAIWGYNEEGQPNFEVFRNAQGKWDMRPKKEERNDSSTERRAESEPPTGGG